MTPPSAGRLLAALAVSICILCFAGYLAREHVVATLLASATGGEAGIESVSSLSLSGIRVHGINISTDDYLFSAETAEINLDLGDYLFRHTLHLKKVELIGADLVINPTLKNDKSNDPSARMPDIVLRQFLVSRFRIDYEDADQDFVANIDECLGNETGNSVSWQCDGRINQESLMLEGLYGLPDAQEQLQPFRLALNWQDVTLDMRGRMDHPMSTAGAELSLELEAKRGTPLLKLLGINEVRDSPIRISADYADTGNNITLNLDSHIGDMRLVALGNVDDIASTQQLSFDVDLSGPSLFEAGALIDYLEFEDVPFKITGNVTLDPSDGLRANEIQFSLDDGTINATLHMPKFPTTENMALDLQGKDASPTLLQPIVGSCDLPQEALSWQGAINVDPAGIENVDFSLEGPAHRLNVRGTLNTSNVTGAVDLFVRSSGFTFQEIGRCFDLELPAVATNLYTEFSWQNGLLTFRGIDLESPLFGASGSVTVEPSEKVPFDIKLHLKTDDARALVESLQFDSGPLNRFPLTGDLVLTGDTTQIPVFSFNFSASDHPGTITGSLGRPDTLNDLDLKLDVSGNHLGKLLLDPEKQSRIDQPFSLTSHLRKIDHAWLLEDIALKISQTEINGNARLGENSLLGSEISVSVKGENLEHILGPWFEVPVPNVPFEIEASAKYEAKGIEVPTLSLQLGEHRMTANLLVDNPPDYSGSDGHLTLSGPSTQALMQFIGSDRKVLDRPYELSFDISGDRSFLMIDNLIAVAGETDLRGSLQLAKTSPPTVNANLTSNGIYLALFDPGLLDESQSDPSGKKKSKVFSDDTLPFNQLESINGQISFKIAEMWLNPAYKTSLDIDLMIQAGGLTTRRFIWEGEHAQGTLTASVEPSESGYDIKAKASSDRLPLIWLLAGEAEPSDNTDFQLNLDSTGTSIASIMANLNGTILFKGGAGRIKGDGLDLLFADFMQSIASRISDNRDKTTRIACTAAAISIEKGVATVNPGLLARTSKVDVFATGVVDLAKESPNLTVLTKSRTGIGLSATKVIAPRLKVRGTLASPKFQIDSTGTAVNTWLALYSGGLSLIASGLWDRMSGSADACGDLYRQASELPAFKPKTSDPQT